MATDVTVILEDRPGELARRLGEEGVNIELAYTTFGGVRRDRDYPRAGQDAVRTTIAELPIRIADEREALVVDIQNQPGSLGELSRRLGEANVNIELAYTTFGGVKVVIVTDDMDAARAVL